MSSKFEQVAAEIAKLVAEKNAAYGDSFRKSGDVLAILYPNGVKPEQYGDFLAIVRIIDKLFRIGTQKDAFGEDPWKDVLGYAINAVSRNVESKEQQPGPGETRLFLLVDANDDCPNTRYVARSQLGEHSWGHRHQAYRFTELSKEWEEAAWDLGDGLIREYDV